MQELRLIGDQRELHEFAEHLSAAGAIAIDTEFVRESTYYPKLCLLQLATDGAVAGIDCLADMNLSRLYDVLYDPARPWVLHSARQDLEVLWNATGRMPDTLIDTQVAAALVGFAPQISLGDLLAQTLGVELEKAHARTDWTKRPIAEAHLRYALDDVRHLLGVRAHLENRLAELGRRDWLVEDSSRLAATPPVTDAATLWSRLRGLSRLPAAARQAALALVHWREGEAQRLDRPRRWILSDELLIAIARAQPETRDALAATPEMPKRLAARAGRDILAALRDAAEHDVPEPSGNRAEPADKSLVKTLQTRVAARARELNLHAEILATRRDLAALAVGDPPDHLTTGWRAAELGDILQAAPAP